MSETRMPDSPVGVPSKDNSVNVPHPASIDPPENDTPNAFDGP